jgi:hypothetical protein
MRYDGDIMMSRTQITLEQEIQLRARQRASDLGMSFAEYVRRLVARDLGGERPVANPAVVFDLGASDGSNVAANKDAMLAEAFTSRGRKPRRRSA